MTDASEGDQDDWVKEALADAIFGPRDQPSGTPVPEAAEVDDAAASTAEALAQATDATIETTEPVEQAAEPVEEAAEPVLKAAEPPAAAAEPVAAKAEASTDAISLLDLESPSRPQPTPAPDAEAAPSLEANAAQPETELEPGPAAVSRLFERPNFDATRDPGVDEMLAAERTKVADLDEVEERTRLRGAVEWLVVLGSAVIVALLLRAFLFQAFYIPSESMESTLLVDDRILVSKLSYRIGEVERGEVVVFRRPEDQPGVFEDLIKRVIGLPGETIEARDNTIYINGQVLIEPYLTPGEVIGDFDPVEIPAGEYFVMGDNRDNSGDSRIFGTISDDLLIGRAFFVFWPLDRLGSL